ncbi:MAG: hypothetical protein RLZZ381_3838, partial [Cyanobacteriota bacterium]
EVEHHTLSIRTRQQGDLGAMSMVELQESFEKAIANKANI